MLFYGKEEKLQGKDIDFGQVCGNNRKPDDERKRKSNSVETVVHMEKEMERKCSRKYLIGILLIIAFCSHFRLNGNVFDRMRWARLGGVESFSNVKEVVPQHWDRYDEYLECYDPTVRFYYNEEILRDEFDDVTVLVSKDKSDLYVAFGGDIVLSDKLWLVVDFKYDYRKRCLTYEPISVGEDIDGEHWANFYYDEKTVRRYMEEYGITDEDIREYQDYILYDLIVKTWAEGNNKITRYEAWKVKYCKTVDNTFAFEAEQQASGEIAKSIRRNINTIIEMLIAEILIADVPRTILLSIVSLGFVYKSKDVEPLQWQTYSAIFMGCVLGAAALIIIKAFIMEGSFGGGFIMVYAGRWAGYYIIVHMVQHGIFHLMYGKNWLLKILAVLSCILIAVLPAIYLSENYIFNQM